MTEIKSGLIRWLSIMVNYIWGLGAEVAMATCGFIMGLVPLYLIMVLKAGLVQWLFIMVSFTLVWAGGQLARMISQFLTAPLGLFLIMALVQYKILFQPSLFIMASFMLLEDIITLAPVIS